MPTSNFRDEAYTKIDFLAQNLDFKVDKSIKTLRRKLNLIPAKYVYIISLSITEAPINSIC
jgi:hypothetical protein